jgi:serine phosphatase RsbU (regulator of sigma subunit)
MSLRFKFVVPLNVILLAVLAASLGWEWRRLEQAEATLLRTRLSEEARFVLAASRTFGVTPAFSAFLARFCRATDALASPEHQVALLDRRTGRLLGQAAEHAHHRMDLGRLASPGEGFATHRERGESYLVRTADEGDRRVVIAESTRMLQRRVRAALWDHAAWIVGLGLLLLAAINLVMRRAVLRPVRRLYRAARQLEEGRLGVQVDWSGRDELGALSARFNAMSRALAQQAEAARRELEAAERVQSHLLPPAELSVGDLVIAGQCRQKGPVGGDIYDVRLLPDGRVSLLIADLSGHNVAAALHTALVRGLVGRESEWAGSPAEVLNHLNRRLFHDLPEDHFASALLAWFDPETGRLVYANAGHPAGLLRHADGRVEEFAATGPPLGILPDEHIGERSLGLEPGAVALLYTDGLTEARNPQGALWGTGRLRDWLGLESVTRPGASLERLLTVNEAFREGAACEDDRTVVLVQLAPARAASSARPRPARRLSLGAT